MTDSYYDLSQPAQPARIGWIASAVVIVSLGLCALISSERQHDGCTWEECMGQPVAYPASDYECIQDIHWNHPDWTYEQAEAFLFTPLNCGHE